MHKKRWKYNITKKISLQGIMPTFINHSIKLNMNILMTKFILIESEDNILTFNTGG
jgi:hypothetical protein